MDKSHPRSMPGHGWTRSFACPQAWHLSQNDYYAAGEIRLGQWIGLGAERWGASVAQPVRRITVLGSV